MAHLERLAITVAFLTLTFIGYFWIGLTTDPGEARSLATPLDARIPFVPASIVVYAGVYILITLPVFLVESRALFARVVVAYLFVVFVCLLSFALFPVSGAALRPDLSELEIHPFLLWGLKTNYGLDPPVNLFPSMHLAGATIAALSVGKARRRDGWIAGAAVVPVAIAVCTVKQHFWVDAVAGIALGFAGFALLLRRFELPPGERASRGPGGWAAFGALAASLYAGLYVAYRAGIEPWGWL